MKKIISVILSFALLMIMLTGCTTNEMEAQNKEENKPNEITLDTLRKSLNEQRKQEVLNPLVHTIDDYGIIEKNDSANFSDDEVEKFSTWVHYQNKITRDEALEDIDELMRLLKTSYGGYNYFGGDKVFGEAKERMVRRVNETYNDEMDISYPFYLIIKEEMAFIEDSRLRIGRSDSYFSKNHIFYDTEKMDFIEDEDGYYTVIDNQILYLATDDEKYHHLTVNDTGKLVYGLFGREKDSSALPKTIVRKSKNGEEYKKDITWTITEVGPRTNNPDIIHEYYDIEDIPVSTLRQMSVGFHNQKMTNDFIDEAKELRNKDVFILDLRENIGGINEIADFFLYNLTDSKCDSKMQFVKRYSRINKNIEELIEQNKELTDLSNINFYKENKELVDSWMEETKCGDKVEDGETVIIDNKAIWNDYENNIIVLVNHNTMDSAEYFLSKLATLDNVIIMGTNTNGCMVTDNIIDAEDIYLYNTGIPINFSPTLMIHDKMDGFDTNGWIPDIITRTDALDAAVALIKNHSGN